MTPPSEKDREVAAAIITGCMCLPPSMRIRLDATTGCGRCVQREKIAQALALAREESSKDRPLMLAVVEQAQRQVNFMATFKDQFEHADKDMKSMLWRGAVEKHNAVSQALAAFNAAKISGGTDATSVQTPQ